MSFVGVASLSPFKTEFKCILSPKALDNRSQMLKFVWGWGIFRVSGLGFNPNSRPLLMLDGELPFCSLPFQKHPRRVVRAFDGMHVFKCLSLTRSGRGDVLGGGSPDARRE